MSSSGKCHIDFNRSTGMAMAVGVEVSGSQPSTKPTTSNLYREEDDADYDPTKADGKNAFDWKLVKVFKSIFYKVKKNQ
jgi:hypothetical protein